MDFQSKGIAYNGLVFLAFVIVAVTLLYTNDLANDLKIEEKKKVALWAKATKELSNMNDSNYDIGFVFEVVNNNTTVPVIHTNSSGEVLAYRNIKNASTDEQFKNQIRIMKRKYEPIEIELIDGTKEYIYYKESRLLQRLRNFPIFMFLIVAAFMLIAYSAFSNARIAQQNKVWTGMAKETAHQIGTPLSSLMGWLEYLKEKEIDQEVLREIQKDLARLTTIASRFSKIGSLPKLEKLNIVPVLDSAINYMRKRMSTNTTLDFSSNQQKAMVLVNEELFQWVIENIVKNSIDAISNKGKIQVKLIDKKHHVIIDIIDNGRGLKKSVFKQVFLPGFTSKKRGWGLGLSLVKRIIEDYHKGQVNVVRSIPNKETIIRILLNKE
ncbi:MAG: hypothetical protein CMP54_02060 [Flavobacteriales bacterium]|nr:hypothetical protein [Flavobacteriales bacterium]|tara:strand:- start:1106 stop:2248 length:1143 start_codon:yes stop_codon:yes gene_type:complete